MNKVEYRPSLEIEKDREDTILEFACLLVLKTILLVSIISFIYVDDIIPIHFNFRGEVDGYGDKIFLLLFPLISIIIYTSMTWLEKKPHIYNYPKKITKENFQREYIKAVKLMRWIKFLSVSIFLFAILEIIVHYFNLSEIRRISFTMILVTVLFIFYKIFEYLIKK